MADLSVLAGTKGDTSTTFTSEPFDRWTPGDAPLIYDFSNCGILSSAAVIKSTRTDVADGNDELAQYLSYTTGT